MSRVCKRVRCAGAAGSATFTNATSMTVQSGDVVTNAANTVVKDLTVATGGTLDATNSGTIETPYVIVFTGPLVAPSLEHVVQAKILSFSGTLAAGETLVVDSQSKTVMLNGTASRYVWLISPNWFKLLPGANGLRFAGGSGSGSVQISYRNAWL